MIFEVIGVYERNKGALLMLEAIKAELSKAEMKPLIAVPITMPRDERRRLGLAGVLDATGGLKTRLLNTLPAWALRLRGLVKAADVQVVLDASGFGYGDFWGEAKLKRRLVQRLAGWKTVNRVAVMLPQALGPFTTTGIADQFRKALDLVDLAFVRDEASMKHVREVSNNRSIRRAPDFTNLLHPSLPPRLADYAGSCFIIPNEKMVAGDRAPDRDGYVAFMAQAGAAMRERGLLPRILVHEGIKDRELANEINRKAGVLMEVVDVPSPLETKALIAAARLIVSSRFHGLVSALSAGVPALACGWSHKYAELMADYGSSEMMVMINQPESWQSTLHAFLDQAAEPEFTKQLRTAAEAQRAHSQAMWDEVLGLIRSRVQITKV